jgi:hypothetical protein
VESHEKLSKDSQSPGQELNPGVLTTRSRRSVGKSHNSSTPQACYTMSCFFCACVSRRSVQASIRWLTGEHYGDCVCRTKPVQTAHLATSLIELEVANHAFYLIGSAVF